MGLGTNGKARHAITWQTGCQSTRFEASILEVHRTRYMETEAAALACNVSQPLGPRWFREAGGMAPIDLAPHSGRYQASALLTPLVEAIRHHVMAASKLHADDTPVPVLAPGHGKTRTGRLWVYVRDDRPAAGKAAPAVWFAYTENRKGEHPRTHLERYRGVLQADAYGDYQAIYDTGRMVEAACWTHARRKFYELEQARPSPVTAEALRRIGEVYAIEAKIRGKPPDERRRVRQAETRPKLESLREWLNAIAQTLSRKSDTMAAIRYALNRWDALVRYCDNGAIEIDNSAAERTLRGVALGRKTICSPVPIPAANARPRCTVSSVPRA